MTLQPLIEGPWETGLPDLISKMIPIECGETKYHTGVCLAFYSSPVVKLGLKPRALDAQSRALPAVPSLPKVVGWLSCCVDKYDHT